MDMRVLGIHVSAFNVQFESPPGIDWTIECVLFDESITRKEIIRSVEIHHRRKRWVVINCLETGTKSERKIAIGRYAEPEVAFKVLL